MYKLTKHTSIIRLADNATIPADPANRDYAEYLEWLAAGNTPAPVPPKTPVELAAEAELAELIAHRADVKADAFIQQFVGMTPAQVIAHVNSNVSNLADAKQLLAKFGLMLLLVAKDQFK